VDEVDELPSPLPVLPSRGLVDDFKSHVRGLREFGSWLFGLEVLRTLCLCALLGLSIYATVQAESPTLGVEKYKNKKGRKHRHKGHHNKSTVDDYSTLEWGEFGVCTFYVGDWCLGRDED
jgi:hypothetical protein